MKYNIVSTVFPFHISNLGIYHVIVCTFLYFSFIFVNCALVYLHIFLYMLKIADAIYLIPYTVCMYM